MIGTWNDQGIETHGLTVDLAGRPVLRGIDLKLAESEVTAIIGPNGCGKSTLLRACAGIIRPSGGRVTLDGEDLQRVPAKTRARRIGFLPQSPETPEGIRVRTLVARGRTPHQGPFGIMTRADQAAVDRAIDWVGLDEIAGRRVDRLSGGQRQRAWIALTLAQDSGILLLDEPTTYLDPPHQVEMLKLVRRLNGETGRTVAMVLHDITLAALFADRIVGVRDGRVLFQTGPGERLDPDRIRQLFDMEVHAVDHPTADRSIIVPVT